MTTPGQEFKLRVPKNLVKDYYVMKVNSARPVKIDTISEAYLARKTSQYEEDGASAGPSSGAGSVYGKERKEESRRKRRGIIQKQVKQEDLPFSMRLGPKESKAKIYTGKKEGGILDNSSYYVLTQCADGVFEAMPVHAWFNFTADIQYTTMTMDEAEYEFSKRDKTINYWNLKIQKQLDDKVEDDPQKPKSKIDSSEGELKIHDDENLSDAVEVEEFTDDDSDSDDAKKKTKKKKPQEGKRRPTATKKQKKGSDQDEVASDEEEELENAESREVDYLSESSGEELELEDEPEPEKFDVKAKDDLNAAELSESSEEEDENEEGEKLTDIGKELKQMLHRDDKEAASSAEDDDDEEEEDIDGDETYSKSAVFMQGKDGKKKRISGGGNGNTASASNSRSSTPTLQSSVASTSSGTASTAGPSNDQGKKKSASKRPLQATPTSSSKRAKVVSGSGDAKHGAASKHSHHSHHKSVADDEEGAITEKAIRRYLSHKPMTPTDLVRKFKRKRTGLTKKQTVDTIAAILKKIEPQREQKDSVLYLSLKPK